MEQARVSARNATLVIRVASIPVVVAGVAIAVYALLVADPETVALLQGAGAGTLVMWPCGFLCGYIIAKRRQQPQHVEGEVVEGIVEGEAREVTPTPATWKLVERRTGKTLIEVRR